MTYEQLIPKIESELNKLSNIEAKASDVQLAKNHKAYRETMQALTRLHTIKDINNKFIKTSSEIEDSKALLHSSDKEMRALAEQELETLEVTQSNLLNKLRKELVPVSPLDSKHVIIEIRAGAGGDEASLFVTDLMRMYMRYAEQMGWNFEVLDRNETELGGHKEAVFSLSGESYGILRFESGVHRVQRIPTTESSGRIHTSTVTVAVLPEVEETEIEIKNEDLRIDVYRSSGPGGQSVNTTDSAVRITHIPTGLVVTCQDEKSQHKNKAKALRVLRAHLTAFEEEKKESERSANRRSQIGTGDRSERIRTYNYPQNRVTDHRINLTLYQLDRIMEGALEPLISEVRIQLTELEHITKMHAS